MFEYKIKGLKLRINPIFFALFPAAAIMNLMPELLFLLVFAALHELAHMFTGAILGYPPGRLEITPLGLGAGLDSLTLAPAAKKYVIYLSGPLVSLAAAVIGYVTGQSLVLIINAALFLFNILPASTLDGGRVLFAFIAKNCGFLCAANVMIVVNRVVCGFIIAVGIVQVALFPPNLTLFALGVFLLIQGRTMRRLECLQFVFGITSLLDKYTDGRRLRLRFRSFPVTAPVKKLFDSLCYDTISIFYIYNRADITDIMPEGKLISLVKENGLVGSVSDLAKWCQESQTQSP